MEKVEDDSKLKGQAEIWQHIAGYVGSMVLKCAVELRIADIIHSHGGPISLSQIASGITTTNSQSLNMSYLERIMRLLVQKNIFSAHHVDHDHSSNLGKDQTTSSPTTLYGLTDLSKWILWDTKPSLVPLIRIVNHPLMMAPWQYLSQCVKDGDFAFKKAHGCSSIWEFSSTNPEIDTLFNDAMSDTVSVTMHAFIEAYKDGFSGIGSLVDVGGRTGENLHEIVKSHPHIKGINFDLPHVIAKAPLFKGVTNVGGNMFESIPNADAVFMKGIIHDWTDEMCVEILKNCRKAIPENTGKLIIVDNVLELESDYVFKESHVLLDLIMMVITSGKERTEAEWKKLLEEGGFPRYKIFKIPATECIIEAYPK
ncbi:desmethylxanthohumol 6'-O-methyltransferase-like [Ziziphus jujuba]|uniref:Desmethylxanthohumol 6'-O-methyltransferase-like n=1 Tax=Ziziphus jujuba TaxID=326968 RepID=A0A6P3YX22_ZIZJJ|nr:desmethylxanthohumol 6'-O-methyltransferase-like [Ziziphus jujuba]